MNIHKFYFGDGNREALDRLFYDSVNDLFNTGKALKTYNSEEFDLVPKKSYTEKLIKEKESLLESLKEKRTNINRQLNEEEEALKLEIDQLKQKLAKTP